MLLYQCLLLKRYKLFLQTFVLIAYNFFPSSSMMVSLIIISSLVFFISIFILYLTVVKVVILIFKHATTLLLSRGRDEAITMAVLDYQDSKVDSKIQEFLMALTPEDSAQNVADFIMATEVCLYASILQPYDLIISAAKTGDGKVQF